MVQCGAWMASQGAAIPFSGDSIYVLFISIFWFFSLMQFFNNEMKALDLNFLLSLSLYRIFPLKFLLLVPWELYFSQNSPFNAGF